MPRLSREGGNPEVYQSIALPHWVPAFGTFQKMANAHFMIDSVPPV